MQNMASAKLDILVCSDAWHDQVNGVVRTYEHLGEQLLSMGHSFDVIGPKNFKITVPLIGYEEIKLAIFAHFSLPKMIEARLKPNTHIHIATEGPIGRAAAAYCKKNKIPFTTTYHTEFPDYAAKRIAKHLPFLYTPVRNIGIHVVRSFHNQAKTMFVATDSLERKIKSQGFTVPLSRLTRGVKLNQFRPGEKTVYKNLKGPIAVCVARVAIEKNLEMFFESKWEGSMVMVGDGPDLEYLKQKYPHVTFVGKKFGEELAEHYRSADLFVFPSKTDTFGMVLVEAMACGLPIAAYPVTGPADIVTQDFLGALEEDLSTAMAKAMQCPGTAEDRYRYASSTYTWDIVAQQFIDATVKYA
jgi:glycosyltransferase involved in cell wall biosynthesis